MKGIWNRLRLALLGGILAFAGAGMISPLAGGVVAEAASSDWVGKTFEKVSSVDELQHGDAILLANGNNFAGEWFDGQDSKDYLSRVTATAKDPMPYQEGLEVFILGAAEGKENTYTIECDALSDGKYLYYNGKENAVHLTTSSSSNSAQWAFSLSSGKFSLKNVQYSDRILQYNISSPRFACYTTSQQKLDIYRYRASFDDIMATGTLQKTEYFAGDAFDPTGIDIHGYIGGVDQGVIDPAKITWEPSVLDAGTTSVEAVFVNADGSEVRCTVGGITVTEREAIDIEISLEGEIRYEIGDTRDYEGVTVKAIYADGSTSDVTAFATFDPAKGTVVGIEEEGHDVEVHVTYLTFTKTFSYSVSFSPALEYTAAFSDFGSSGNIKSTVSIGDLNWILSFSDNGEEYLGNDGSKGVQFGSKGNPFDMLSLRSPLFVGGGKSLITEISVNASMGSSGKWKLSVYVGGQLIGSSNLTTSSAEYTYYLEEPAVGHVEISFTPTGTGPRAVYLKSISIGGSSVTGTGDDSAIAALNKLEAVDGCAYSTPEEIVNLESIVDEYDETCANYPAFAAAMLDDYESGDVTHANGIQKDYVAAGEKAESIRGRITTPEAQPFFSFQGDGSDGINWAIAGASLGIAVLGAAGYLFYRKKKVAR